ncbi:MAG: 4Fe-4S dicluster domain-containing protein, partial [Oscillospiraceae bacterium]|nr:4Fe-4S dicluster domain-containing protein [Oscillospiraceae bacterium]
YMDENYQAGQTGLRKAHEKGIPVIVMEPLLGGKLATGLPPKAVQLFKKIDAESSAASWAFRWLWNQPEVTVVLSGMNSMEQLSDNINTAETAKHGMITDEISAVFELVIAEIHMAYKVPCTGCNYCMPCPNNVNIPGCFAAYNTFNVMGRISGFTQYVTGTGASNSENQRGPKNCVKCGVCEQQCPQHIEIIKQLEVVRRSMEPFWFNPVIWLVQKLMR